VAPFLLVGGFLQLSRGAQEMSWPTISAAFSSGDREENAVNQVVVVFNIVQSFSLPRANANRGSALAKHMNTKHSDQSAVFSCKAGP